MAKILVSLILVLSCLTISTTAICQTYSEQLHAFFPYTTADNCTAKTPVTAFNCTLDYATSAPLTAYCCNSTWIQIAGSGNCTIQTCPTYSAQLHANFPAMQHSNCTTKTVVNSTGCGTDFSSTGVVQAYCCQGEWTAVSGTPVCSLTQCPTYSAQLHASFPAMQTSNCSAKIPVKATGCSSDYTTNSTVEAYCCAGQWNAVTNSTGCSLSSCPATSKEWPNVVLAPATSNCSSPSIVQAHCAAGYVWDSSIDDIAAYCCNASWVLTKHTGSCVSPSVPNTGKSKSFALTYAGANDVCLVFGYDNLVFTPNNTGDVDLSSVTPAVVGECSFWIPTGNKTYNQSAYVTLMYNASGLSVNITMSVMRNASFSARSTSALIPNSGDESVYVAGVIVQWPDHVELFQGPLFSAANGSAYGCGNTVNTTNPNNAAFAVTNVVFEGLIPPNNFAADSVDSNSVCPDDSTSKNEVGLIIGGVIAGIAGIGILVFVYMQCTAKRQGYTSLN